MTFVLQGIIPLESTVDLYYNFVNKMAIIKEMKENLESQLLKTAIHLTFERWNRRFLKLEKEFMSRYKNDIIPALPSNPVRQHEMFNYKDFIGWDSFWLDLKATSVITPIFGKMVRDRKRSEKLTRKNIIKSSQNLPVSFCFFKELEDLAASLNVGLIGYTEIPQDSIFSDMGILYKNAIVLGMEMRAGPILSSPDFSSGKESFRVYRDLGHATNELSAFILRKGYKAQPIHPYLGSVLLPYVASCAGLGYSGFHGLLLTKSFGPRQRLSIISTDIRPNVLANENPMANIREFCRSCLKCIEACPGKAFYNPPLIGNNGQTITHIDMDKCYPYIVKLKGCSICVKVCSETLLKSGLIDREGSSQSLVPEEI